MRLAPLPLQSFQKAGLASFDGDVVVGFALLDQMRSQFALGQQGIGRLALNILRPPRTRSKKRSASTRSMDSAKTHVTFQFSMPLN